MKCTNPRIIIRTDVDVPNWVRRLKFDDRLREREFYPEYFMIVPCGHCRPCRKAKAREWSIKLLYESESWSKTSFVSLDYAPEFLPMMNPPEDGVSFAEYYGTLKQVGYNFGSTLVREAVPDFMKRVRSAWKRKNGFNLNCKVYYCGEYGDDFGRPHYHICMFGLNAEDRELLEDCWPFGRVDIGNLELFSIQYVTGYVRKKLDGKLGREVYGARLAPFQGFSKGFGLDYFKKHHKKFEQDLTAHFHGIKCSFPRYFLKKDEDLANKVKEKSLDSPPLLSSFIDDPDDFERDIIQRRTDCVRNAQVHTKHSVF